jgi:hypothetical protein
MDVFTVGIFTPRDNRDVRTLEAKMIVISNHARIQIEERLRGLPVDSKFIESRLQNTRIPDFKIYIEVCKFNRVVSSGNGDSSRGDILVAIVESNVLKTIVLTMSNTSGQYKNRIHWSQK